MAVRVVLSEIQRDTLQQLCDTFAPSLDVPGDNADFYARSASDLGVPDAVEQALSTQLPEDQLGGLRDLLEKTNIKNKQKQNGMNAKTKVKTTPQKKT